MLKPYPSFDLLDDAGGLVLAAFLLTVALGIPGLFLIGEGPIATPIGIALLIIPCLLLATATIILVVAFFKFVVGEAADSIRSIRSERKRHLQYLAAQQKAQQASTTREQQRQVIIELERREHEKRSHSDPMQ